jgi:hypothetical protein
MKPNTRLVDVDSLEWKAIWLTLALHPLNSGCIDPFSCKNDGEVWQYMGTDNDEHVFRHRFHPKTGKREYLKLKS